MPDFREFIDITMSQDFDTALREKISINLIQLQNLDGASLSQVLEILYKSLLHDTEGMIQLYLQTYHKWLSESLSDQS